MEFPSLSTSMMFGSPFGIIVFGAGVIVGYLVSENRRINKRELDEAYDELNQILLEKEGRIDELEDYIDTLLDKQKQKSTPHSETKGSSTKPRKIVTSEPDDLTRIEGIGPKTAEVLKNAGIQSYLNLSETSLDSIKQILEEAGTAYLRHGYETWAKQAQLAAKGEWDALKAWQDKG
jgi:small subunit ribosomal protein S2